MKPKTLFILSVVPILQMGFGVAGMWTLRHYPNAQEATHVRDFIKQQDAKKDKPTTNEAEMLGALKNALKSLDDYYAFYNPLKNMQQDSLEMLTGFGAVELVWLGTLYVSEKKRAAPALAVEKSAGI